MVNSNIGILLFYLTFIFYKTVKGLKVLHDRKVFHRDLKVSFFVRSIYILRVQMCF